MQSYKVSERTAGPGMRAVLSPPTPPKASDFDLSSVRIEPAHNGCIVECTYKMKPDVEQKMKGKAGKDYVDYDVRNPTIKKVFQGAEAEAIKAAIQAALSGKKEESGEKKERPVKVKVA